MRRARLALFLSLLALPAFAEDIGSVGYRFKWLGPNDKIGVEAFDDPDVPGVTCYMSHARTGGIKGAIGLAEDPGEASIACRQVGAVDAEKLDKITEPARGVQLARLADLQDHAGHPILGRQAQGAGLSRLHRPHHRGQPAQLDQRRAGRE